MSPYIINELVLATKIPDTHGDDEILASGDTLTIKRAGVVYATRTIVERRPVAPGIIPSNRDLYSVFLIERNPMASGVMATLVGARIEEGTGKYYYTFSNGQEREYIDRDAVLAVASNVDNDTDKAMDILVGMSVRRDENGGNVGVMVGRSCTIDCAASTPVSISATE